ncbi:MULTISPECIES: S49 family peptidase [unclassified Bradyrhizobium]|uniref:S49 family peptidase n=1 Tax=unclassified Bradyrhizobium TaxID=2631580 RepID=UPI002916EA51|nr:MULTISPECIES: S49 family peptidase [unclassified Bradyrhizobium]
MPRTEPIELRRVIAEISAIDPAVAIELSVLAECLVRSIAREAAAAAGSVPAQPSKIALISVSGPLTPRGSYYGSSLSDIAAQARRAGTDPDVAAIIGDFDTPGGTVAGTAEAAAAFAEAAQKKPVIAVVNTLAASAGYWIASQASEIVMTPSADVGSIGAMVMHVDYGKALEEAGINVTMIRSEQSPLKNEAHPFGPLSDDARSYLQGRVNDSGAEFIRAVAAGRKVSPATVRKDFGQGRMFGAKDAVARGMADRIGTLDQVISGLVTGGTRAVARRRSALAFD